MKTTTATASAQILENYVIGALSRYGDSIWSEMADLLTPDSFSDRFCRAAFTAAQALATRGESISSATIPGEIEDAGGGDMYAAHDELLRFGALLPKDAESAARGWALKIARAQAARQIAEAGTVLASDTGDIENLIAIASQQISEASSLIDQDTTQVDAAETMRRTLAAIAEASQAGGAVGIQSGLTELDALLAGFKAGELIILAARPAMGKTALSLSIAEHVAITSGTPTLVFSLEMGADQLGMRLLSMRSSVPMGRLRVGDIRSSDTDAIQRASDEISASPLTIDEAASITLPKIFSRAKRWKKSIGEAPGLVIIDYLTLISDSGKKGATQSSLIGEISRGLKQLAREIGCPVLCLSQLNRDLEKRQDKRPMMSDLRDSGAIEQDADVILFLYRDEVYNKSSPDAGTAELICAKQRSGSTGTVRLTYDAPQTRFVDLRADSMASAPALRVYKGRA